MDCQSPETPETGWFQHFFVNHFQLINPVFRRNKKEIIHHNLAIYFVPGKPASLLPLTAKDIYGKKLQKI